MKARAWVTSILALALVPVGGAVWAGRSADGAPPARALARSDKAEVAPVLLAPLPAVKLTEEGDRSFVGVVLSAESADVAARLDGRIETMHVRLGDRVAAGARIASMDRRALQRELATLRAGRRALAAEADRSGIARTQAAAVLDHRRAASGSVSGEELANAEFGDQSAALNVEVAKARLAERDGQIAQLQQRIDDADVSAPFDGVVSARYVDRGVTVARGAPLIRLVGAGAPRVRFAVPENAVDGLGPHVWLSVAVSGVADALDAEVENVAPEVDAASRMTYVEAQFSRPVSEAQLAAMTGRIARVSVKKL